jgi:hypothetical protein
MNTDKLDMLYAEAVKEMILRDLDLVLMHNSDLDALRSSEPISGGADIRCPFTYEDEA